MSQLSPEPRAIADAVFEAINSGDLDAFMALVADDVEFTSMVAEAEGTTFRGRDGLRAWWETIRGAFQNVSWELLDFRATGDGGVTHIRMAGTLSGVPVEQTMWQAVKLRGGKVAWWASFRSERDALEAAGLPDQAIPHENGQVLRQSLDAFNRRDKAPWVALCHPEVEWLPPAHWPETATIRGPDATWDFMLALNEPWEEGSYELMELIDATEDTIAARVGRHVRGQSSGIAAEFEYWAVVRFRDGKVLRIEWFADRDEALEAAGLSE